MALGVALVAAATGWPGTAAEEEPRPFDAVQKLEYDVTYQSRSTIARHSGGLHVANRAHDLRLYFGDDRVDIVQRDTVEATWHLELHLESIRVGPRVHVARPVAPVASGSRVAYRHAVGTVGWTNAPAGVAVNLEVDSPEGDVSVEWTFGFRTELAVVGSSDGRGVGFYDLGRPVVQLCWAGSPRGRFRVSGSRLTLTTTAGESRDAIRLRLVGGAFTPGGTPVSSTPTSILEGEQPGGGFGQAISTAGDVNGDGFSDLVVGAPDFDGGAPGTGRAIVFLGSSAGIETQPSWSWDSGQPGAALGTSVASIGDLDGDGFDDVVVGAPRFGIDAPEDDDGRAWVFLGGANGLSPTPHLVLDGQAASRFATALSTAGDIDGDGYADLIVGAPLFSGTVAREGAAYAFMGSANGLEGEPRWRRTGEQSDSGFGAAVATAGDVNGDGLADVLVGAPLYLASSSPPSRPGRVLLYLGSATGPRDEVAWTKDGEDNGGRFGGSLAGAGNVNGDRFADVIIGAPAHDEDEAAEGRAQIFLGWFGGLRNEPLWTVDGNASDARFGTCVASAGDVDGDGYGDVLVGGVGLGAGGQARVYRGSPTGPALEADAVLEVAQPAADLGASCATAGDVDGDGFSDVAVGAPGYDDTGAVFLYDGRAALPSESDPWTADGGLTFAALGSSLAAAGDVDGDGYGDLIVGAPTHGADRQGQARVYLGSAGGPDLAPGWYADGTQRTENFASAVAGVGDVDGDGFDDLLVGAQAYDSSASTEGRNVGRALLYLGGEDGPATAASWEYVGRSSGARLGAVVSAAGDINGDGFADLLVGAPFHLVDDVEVGQALLFLGPIGSPTTEPAWSVEGREFGERTGQAVRGVGDVNGDGFADVAVGSPGAGRDAGRVDLFLGSPTGLSLNPVWSFHGEREDTELGASVGRAGDVNGDGFADVIVGAPGFSEGAPDEGLALLFVGGDSGLATQPEWSVAGELEDAELGSAVAGAGDVDADGFADLLVGVPGDTGGASVRLYRGGSQGPADALDWSVTAEASNSEFGDALGSAGDLDGDGFADVVVGAPLFSGSGILDGRVYAYLGAGGGIPRRPIQLRVDEDIRVSPGGRSDTMHAIRFGAVASPIGHDARSRLEWKLRPLAAPDERRGFSRDATFAPGIGGPAALTDVLRKLTPGTLYAWRLRLRYSTPFLPHSPWIAVVPTGAEERLFRTAGDVTAPTAGPIAPPLDLRVHADDPPLTHAWHRGDALAFTLEWSRNLEFAGTLERSEVIRVDAGAPGVQVYVPETPWRRILRLARNPDFREIPVFWRVVPEGEPPLEVRTFRVMPASDPILEAPPDEQSVPGSPAPELTWQPNHGERFTVRFSTRRDLGNPRVDSGGDFGIVIDADEDLVRWRPEDVWEDVVTLARKENGTIYWAVFSMDALDRLTWSPTRSLRIEDAKAVTP